MKMSDLEVLGKGIGKVFRYNKDDVLEIQNFQSKSAQGREVANIIQLSLSRSHTHKILTNVSNNVHLSSISSNI